MPPAHLAGPAQPPGPHPALPHGIAPIGRIPVTDVLPSVDGGTRAAKSVVDEQIKRIVDFYYSVDHVWVPQESVAATLREYGYKGPYQVVENGIDPAEMYRVFGYTRTVDKCLKTFPKPAKLKIAHWTETQARSNWLQEFYRLTSTDSDSTSSN